LMGLMTTKLPIHVVDFENQNYSYYWFGGRTYYGNEYFYTNLARLTAANYYRLLYNEGTLSGIMSSAFQSLSGFISSFDLHTKLENGFCYGRYSLDANVNSVYLNKPILQVGKYLGSLPFIIEVSGVYNSTPFSQTFTLPENEIFDSDSLNEKAWTGNYIQYLESQTQTNDVVDEIVNYSVGKRVLSIYSAFICLEPSRGGEVCYDCYDESDVINVEDSVVTQNDSLSLSAYPNPFNGQVNIKINLPASLLAKNVTFRIYNVLGQVVKTYSTEGIQASRKYQFIWNGTNDYGSTVASGVYIFVVNTPEKNYSVKLLLMK
jgi:FlgD Ig-like domain